jgi:hypothetical protein
MTPVLSHALEGLILELGRLEQFLKALESLDTRRTKAVLKNAREKFRSVIDSVRAHLHAEAPDGTPAAPAAAVKRQRTLDTVLFSKAESEPVNHNNPELVLQASPLFHGVTDVQLRSEAKRLGAGSAAARDGHSAPRSAHE